MLWNLLHDEWQYGMELSALNLHTGSPENNIFSVIRNLQLEEEYLFPNLLPLAVEVVRIYGGNKTLGVYVEHFEH